MNTEFVAEDSDGSMLRYVATAGSHPQPPRGFTIISTRVTDDQQQEWTVWEE